MFTVIKEWKEQGKNKNHYITVYICTSCCKETTTMRIDTSDKIFWLDRMEYLSHWMLSSVKDAIKMWREAGNKEP